MRSFSLRAHAAVRALTCLGSVVAFGGLSALACGSGAESNDTANGDQSDGGATNGEGDPNTDASDDGPSVNGPFTFRDRLMGWSGGYTGGFYGRRGYAISNKRIFSVPDAISPTLGAVTVADVSAPKARIFTLPVTGTFPAGSVEAFVYEPTTDQMVLLLRPLGAQKLEIVTIAVGADKATFTTLTQAGPVPTSNAAGGPLYATGSGGVVVAALGNTTASFAIAGSVATWSAESSDTILRPGAAAMEDPTHGRVMSYGNIVYDPAAMKAHTEPNVVTLPLTAPYAWNVLPFSGDAPPNVDTVGGGYNFMAYDATGNKVIASSMHDATCGAAPCKVPGLWSFDLGSSVWTKLVDDWGDPRGYGGLIGPFVVQQDARRILEPSDGVLYATSLDTAANPSLARTPLAQDGDLGPTNPVAATVLGDQRIVSTDGTIFRVLDPTVAAPHWDRFGTVTVPSSLYGLSGLSLAADPKTGEVLVFGTPQGASAPMELHVLSADGKKTTQVTADGAPSRRSNQAALLVDGTLYVACGTDAAGSTTALDDVWAFDRASSTWTKIATLPSAIGVATLGLGPSGELLVTGHVTTPSSSTNSPVFAIDRTTHEVRTMEGLTNAPALWAASAYRGCFVGYESGNEVDASKPNVWRCSIENGATKWTSVTIDEHDFALNLLRGATSPDGLHAYFVGRHLWEAIGH